MSYWTSDNIIQMDEKQVSISAENGLDYTVNDTGRKIQLFIPPSVKFLSGKDSYLQFDLTISQDAAIKTRLQLDPAGAGMIVQNLRIYDGSRGNLIEEINEYNQLVAINSDYNTDASLKNIRALTQGGNHWSGKNRGTEGTSQTDYAEVQNNPWTKPYIDSINQDVDFDHTTDNNTVKCCVPLDQSGVFTGDIFPVLMTNGLYIELDLMPAPRIVRQLDSVVRFRRTALNPVFLEVEASSGTNGNSAGIDRGDWPIALNASEVQTWVVSNKNSNFKVSNFPFVVGEKYRFVKYASLTSGNGSDLISQEMTIEEIDVNASGNLRIKNTASINASTSADIDGTWAMFSTTVQDAAAFNPTYKVSNFQFIAHQVILDPAYEQRMLAKARAGKFIEFDIYSKTNYKNSLLASERQGTFLIHANNSKAKSIICIPTDASVYTPQQLASSNGTYEISNNNMDIFLNSARSGITGCCDFLSSVQFQIDGKLVPSRPVSVKKIASRNSIDAFHIFELEKTLSNSKIEPRSLSKYMENFLVGRGFGGSSDGAMDLRGKDLSILLNYSETTAPTKNKTFSTFVCYVKRIRIRGGLVEVMN